MQKLTDKVALITGAGAGVGAATARLFAENGAKLVLADIDIEAAQALAEELPDTIAVKLDVGDEAGWQAAVDQAQVAFGGLDILINNAGIDRSAPLLDTSTELYNAVITTNQLGCFLGMKTAGAVLNKGGAIVNVSSLAGMMGLPGKVAYVASKFAVRGMTKVAALELASRGIRVNSVHPGAVNTRMLTEDQPAPPPGQEGSALEMVAMRRIAEPSEVAALNLYLASDDASYSTGCEFVVDGGILAGPSF
ncbi:SDR family NAD(P)-dependent oxidoreductase [Marinobacterium aestuariivivens]|uniref:SDR family NAD(P)-dependent oxidoreductase n=1 Tax=Marinobacterium aestuariivivens TaxID=1698799 RepID=A0ABW2A3P8_9GAMM